ncbi:DUF4192 family protein [Micrococcus terreus]|uniref:DUF4192 family protein n=1 Tax=Micrococcus terreus TaxID=574650 RepID=UPI0033C37EB2
MENSSPATAPRPVEPPHVRATEPADLLSYIDHSLGFRPRSSCVGLTRRGTSIGAMVRLDLPVALQEGRVAPQHYAELIAGYLSQDVQATDTLIFVFKERVHPEAAGPEPVQDPISGADGALVAALGDALADRGLPLRETWLVDHGCLWHLDCPDPASCPPHGGSVSRSEVSAVNATFIVQGSVVESGPEAARMPVPTERPSLALVAALERAAVGVDDSDYVAAWMQRWERVLDGSAGALSDWSRAELVELVAGLDQVCLRDGLLASSAFTLHRAVSGGEFIRALPRGTSARMGCTPSEASGVLYVSAMLADTVRAPNWDRMDRLREACRDLLPLAAGETASALQCLAAWVDWCRGRGSWAGAVVDQCRARDPYYSMAELLEQLLDQGHLAGWAAREEIAWRRRRP